MPSPFGAAYDAGQQMKRRNQQNRLSELEYVQGQYDDERDRLNASPHFGPDYSGYSGERDYLNGLNRQGEIASLRSTLSGKGPARVSHTYAGTDFARRPSLSALGQLAGVGRTPVADNDVSDNSDYYARQIMLRNGQLQNDLLEDEVNARALDDNAYRVQQRGDIARSEAIRNARAAGEAGAAKYAAEEPVRFDQDYDRRAQARERGYYDPAVESARIKGIADTNKAALDRDRERSAALKAYTDLVKSQSGIEPTVKRKIPGTGFFGWGQQEKEEPNPAYEAHSKAIQDARSVLGVHDEQPGQDVLTEDDLTAFAQENGMSVDEVRALAREYGYAIR